MDYQIIQKTSDYFDFLSEIQETTWLAFDTEFISEKRELPELCLIQAATEKGLVLLDALQLNRLTATNRMRDFWELLCDGKRDVIVHACRSEMQFCFNAVGRMPERLFDVQLAAGFFEEGFPLSFKTLVEHLLNIRLPKEESRTKWDTRPLSELQIEYALDDIRYLYQLMNICRNRLTELGRLDWFFEEIQKRLVSFENEWNIPKWQRIPRIHLLSQKELVIAREIWFWREEVGLRRQIKPAHLLRDDLIIELAKWKSSDPKRIVSLRGLGFSKNSMEIAAQLGSVIGKALTIPVSDCPSVSDNHLSSYSVLTEFLKALLFQKCKEMNISAALVASVKDIREYIASKDGMLPDSVVPTVSQGWKASLVGDYFDQLLSGKLALHLNMETPEMPVVLEEFISDKVETKENVSDKAETKENVSDPKISAKNVSEKKRSSKKSTDKESTDKESI